MVIHAFRRQRFPTFLAGGLLLTAAGACSWNEERTRLLQEVEYLRDRNREQSRLVVQREADVAERDRRIATLAGFGPDRPVDAFAPVSLELAALTRGRDYDGAPGDDGITVHLRPLDADGDVVKAPGTIRIQLLDNSDLGEPRVIRIYSFDELDALRKVWHSRFGTQHYTLRCPFPPNVMLPQSGRLTVTAEFVDYLSGATLRVTKDVPFSLPHP